MKLKRLSLQGYKTFASRTNFEFDDGITAIVGPNGSGKSNIADAIRWVLGEQSYSTLRGKRTTDMIFAGSQQRARSGMAQAILTLDNEEGWLPIDYSEIEIGRRAHRSGDNEYLLNGQRVRLRDITDLLARSGLAQRTYTIIGQGLIDQALSLRADERRMLFEEAAGVSHYKQRRAETLRRLEETTHNLERVQDIIAEIRPRLNSLRRQANRARNHEQVAADLHHLLQIWYGFKWEQARKDLRLARNESEEAHQLWVEARRGQLTLQESLEVSRKELYELQEKLRQAEIDRDEIRERFENVRREVAVLSERQALLKRQLDEHAGELPALEAQRASAAEQLDQAMTELKQAQADLDEQSGQIEAFEASFLTKQDEIDRWQKSAANLEVEHRRAADALSQAKGRVAQLFSQLRERVAEIGEEFDLEAAEGELADLEAKVSSGEEALAAARHRLAERRKEQRQINDSLASARDRRDSFSSQLAKLERQVAGLESQAEILRRPGASEGVIPDGLPALGQLASVIGAPEEYRLAIRSALAESLLTWVLADERSIWRLRDAHHDGRILALALDVVSSGDGPSNARPDLSGRPEVIGWAETLVTAEAPYDKALPRLLGHVLLVKDAKSAYEVVRSLSPGSLAVSLDGFVARGSGIVELCADKAGAEQSARLEQLTEVEEQLSVVQQNRPVLVGKIEKADQQIADLQTALSQSRSDFESAEEEERSLVAELSQAKSNYRLTKQRFDFDQSNAKRAHETIERLENRISVGQATVKEYQESLAGLSVSLEKAQDQLEQLPVAEATEARKQLRQRVQSARTILAGRQAVVDSRQTTLTQVTDQLHRRQTRYEELRSRWQESELLAKQAKLKAMQEELGSRRQTLEPLRASIAERQGTIARMDGELTKLQRGSHESETRYTQARIDLTQKETMLENLKERIHTDLGLVALTFDDDEQGQSPLPLAQVVEELPVVDELPDDIEDSIRRYRGQLNRIGAINPEAPAEYEETLARHDFLVQQTEDLTETKQRLRGVIEDLDDLTSRAFADTVRKVNDVFGGVFERLFGGGSAHLALTDPDDLTISGVDIVARLPRRREQGLALLSGGERSLTAAALIFALLKVSPTPFCVLDEVDAMLDEANINRFRELLAELSERTQFIVITHNRGTVQVAESVYGVSMGADSASQVISIKPEEYIQQGA